MSTIGDLAERTGIDRGEVSQLLGMLREKGWVKTVRRKGGGPILWELTEQGRSVLPPSTPEGYASIGGSEAQELALAARDYYLSKGWFFALGRQDPKMGRRVDCVAYDYDGRTPVAVEIESSEHVFHDHAEQVKRHMMEVSPFGEVHFWAHQDAAEKIMEIRSQLRPEDQARLKVFAVGEGPLR
jgi:DNA-binding MarR family transcriptional regulator